MVVSIAIISHRSHELKMAGSKEREEVKNSLFYYHKTYRVKRSHHLQLVIMTNFSVAIHIHELTEGRVVLL